MPLLCKNYIDHGMQPYSEKRLRLTAWDAVAVTAIACAFLVSGIRLSGQSPTESVAQPLAGENAASKNVTPTLPSIHVDSDLVLIPVTVKDRRERTVMGLARENFRLWDENVEQVIAHFAMEDVPVSVGLVFDASESMRPKLPQARAAVSEFIRTSNPEDEFLLIQFNSRPKILQNFTSRTEDIRSRMTWIEPGGRTALIDAILLCMDEMRHANCRRKAILVISDGGDNESRYTLKELKSRLRESDVQLYAIDITQPVFAVRRSYEDMAGAALLDDIARQTGGQMFEVNELNDLSEAAARIGSALRNQYILGYAPSAPMRDGKYHRVRVKLICPGYPSMRASFRRGYFAPPN